MMNDDLTLVREFAASRSESAFAALVERHLGLVHAAALRQAGDPELAREIAQAVFIILARKAPSLGSGTIISAWLYRTTRYVTADALKARRRRHIREQEAYMQSTLNQSNADTWAQLAPQLDDAMAELGETDRTALVLRFFENKSAREIADAMQLAEAAAQKRVTRALDKLRAIFIKRGITLTAAVIASTVAANAISAAPAGLAVTIKAASLTAAGTGTFTFAKFMTLTNLKFAVGALTIASVTAAFVVQNQAQTKLRADNGALQQQLAQVQAGNATLASQLAAVSNSVSQSRDRFNELLKLRGQVGLLQRQAADAEKLRAENQRLTALHEDLATTSEAMDPEARQQAVSREKMSDAREGVLGIIMFSQDNQGLCPTNYEQMASFFKSGWNGTNDFDIVYQGSLPDISHPADTVVLMEKQAWQTLGGKWAKAYGFADGHAVLRVTPDGNFDEWESQHLLPPPTGR
jgi:RNA polymerase sigma factor (sigma-70 family)